MKMTGYTTFIYRNRTWLDSLVVVNATEAYDTHIYNHFLSSYRNIVNEDLVYINVNTITRPTNMKSQNNNNSGNTNNLYLCGFSEQVFHCLANICNGGGCASQVAAVENIDKKYNLPTPKATNILESTKTIPFVYDETCNQQKWRRLKVFISSTFEVNFMHTNTYERIYIYKIDILDAYFPNDCNYNNIFIIN